MPRLGAGPGASMPLSDSAAAPSAPLPGTPPAAGGGTGHSKTSSFDASRGLLRTRLMCCMPVRGTAGPSAFISCPPNLASMHAANMSSSSSSGGSLAGTRVGSPSFILCRRRQQRSSPPTQEAWRQKKRCFARQIRAATIVQQLDVKRLQQLVLFVQSCRQEEPLAIITKSHRQPFLADNPRCPDRLLVLHSRPHRLWPSCSGSSRWPPK